MKKFEQYQDMIARLFPELSFNKTDEYGRKVISKVVTFQVTDACNLACTYCYQINKGERRMTFETAKKLVDALLSNDPKLAGYINPENSPAIVLEFIGGEPFLNIELIEKVVDYFYDNAIKMCHPWATKFRISICSNGVLYRDPKVQEFLKRYQNLISFSVTIDGNKELHDSCRVFPDGSPSYDLAVDAAQDWMNRGYYMGSKITIAPNNLKYLYDAIIHFQTLGYEEINANTVFEKGWTIEHAKEFYNQLKRISDYWVDNDLVETHYLSLFQNIESYFCPKDPMDNDNWCFKKGTMIKTPHGYIPIEKIKPGFVVFTANGNLQTVESTSQRISNNCYIIKIPGIEDIYTTGEHPFLIRTIHKTVDDIYFERSRWVNAKDINPEKDFVGIYVDTREEYDKIIKYAIDENKVTEEHEDHRIIWIKVSSVEEDTPDIVYNMSVANEHTFIANNVLVHNCGGTGSMLAMDPDGYLYPCIRYMESSLGADIAPLRIGHIDVGIGQTKCDKNCIDCLNSITRRSQSTDECFNCPIAGGCAWCSGYNYQEFGTPNKRATYICDMHKARSLANSYFWNKWYHKTGNSKRFTIYCPDEWALEIISQEELDMLKKLAK